MWWVIVSDISAGKGEDKQIPKFKLLKTFKCGLCGDPNGSPEPRDHEDGGKWGKGITVAQYKAGETISTTSLITAHHKGYIEFFLCPRNDESWGAQEIEACLSPLEIAKSSGGGFKWMLPESGDPANPNSNGGYW